MSWLRVDDSLDTRPKVLQLGTDERRWTWLRILLYSTRYQSATIPPNISHVITKATPKYLADCEAIGLIERATDGTMRIHDWGEHNGQTIDQRNAWRDKKRTQRGLPQGLPHARAVTAAGPAFDFDPDEPTEPPQLRPLAESCRSWIENGGKHLVMDDFLELLAEREARRGETLTDAVRADLIVRWQELQP